MSPFREGGPLPERSVGKPKPESTSKSELSPDEIKKVQACKPDNESLERARSILADACKEVGLKEPEQDAIIQAAKIIGVLGEERIPRAVSGGPHGLWLLTEAYINAGKDPSSIHEATLSLMLGGKPKPETSAGSSEGIKKRISDLKANAVMPMPQKPKAGATQEQLEEYGKRLVWRHIRERLGKRHGVYSAGNMENLYEMMQSMMDDRHPDFKKLYDEVSRKLTAGGAQVDRFLKGVTEEMLYGMVDIIASSGVPIREETSKERYLNSQESVKLSGERYVAEDLTTRNEIVDLYEQLYGKI